MGLFSGITNAVRSIGRAVRKPIKAVTAAVGSTVRAVGSAMPALSGLAAFVPGVGPLLTGGLDMVGNLMGGGLGGQVSSGPSGAGNPVGTAAVTTTGPLAAVAAMLRAQQGAGPWAPGHDPNKPLGPYNGQLQKKNGMFPLLVAAGLGFLVLND